MSVLNCENTFNWLRICRINSRIVADVRDALWSEGVSISSRSSAPVRVVDPTDPQTKVNGFRLGHAYPNQSVSFRANP